MALTTLPTTRLNTAGQRSSTVSVRANTATLVALPVLVVGSAIALIHARAETTAFVEHWRPTLTHVSPVAPPLVPIRPEVVVVAPVAVAPQPVVAAPVQSVVTAEAVTRSAHSEVTSDTESISVSTSDWEGDFGWTWDEASWRVRWESYRQHWRAEWMRRRWAAIAPAVAQLRALRGAMIQEWMSSNAPIGLDSSMLENANSCGAFSCSWTPSSQPTRTTVATTSQPAVRVQRTASSLQLIATDVLLSVRDSAACAISITRPNNPAETVVIATPGTDPQTMAGCTVSAQTIHGQPTLVVRWQGEQWTQVAEISLADATRPQAFITRTRTLSDGSSQIQLSNLSSTHHTWSYGGREIEAAPGDVLQLRSS